MVDDLDFRLPRRRYRDENVRQKMKERHLAKRERMIQRARKNKEEIISREKDLEIEQALTEKSQIDNFEVDENERI